MVPKQQPPRSEENHRSVRVALMSRAPHPESAAAAANGPASVYQASNCEMACFGPNKNRYSQPTWIEPHPNATPATESKRHRQGAFI